MEKLQHSHKMQTWAMASCKAFKGSGGGFGVIGSRFWELVYGFGPETPSIASSTHCLCSE